MPPRDAEFNAIVDRFAGPVFNQALRLLGNREDAEEATQDVFVNVFGSMEKFRGEAELSTWIFRITVNVCASKRRKLRLELEEIDENSEALDAPAEDIQSNPGRLLARTDDRREIASLVALLPGREAAAITLFYLEEKAYSEIAGILEIPEGSVATALHRGRERLRKLISKQERPS